MKLKMLVSFCVLVIVGQGGAQPAALDEGGWGKAGAIEDTNKALFGPGGAQPTALDEGGWGKSGVIEEDTNKALTGFIASIKQDKLTLAEDIAQLPSWQQTAVIHLCNVENKDLTTIPSSQCADVRKKVVRDGGHAWYYCMSHQNDPATWASGSSGWCCNNYNVMWGDPSTNTLAAACFTYSCGATDMLANCPSQGAYVAKTWPI